MNTSIYDSYFLFFYKSDIHRSVSLVSSFNVKVQVALICKSFVAILMFAYVRFLSCMQSVMRLQDSFLIKGATTAWIGTDQVFLAEVFLHVDFKSLSLAVALVTTFKCTFESTGFLVYFLMDSEPCRICECLIAAREIADIWSCLLGVDLLMLKKKLYVVEGLSTFFVIASEHFLGHRVF